MNAHIVEEVGKGIYGEDSVGVVTASVQAHDQSVPYKRVGAGAQKIGEVLNSGGVGSPGRKHEGNSHPDKSSEEKTLLFHEPHHV